MQVPGPGRRRSAAALAAGILLAGGAGAGYAATRPPSYDRGTIPAAPRPAASASYSGAGGPAAPGPAAAAGPGAAPVAASEPASPSRLRIPGLHLNAAIIPVGVAIGGALNIPANPAVIGWWAGGSAPGQPGGTTVLVGHVDSYAAGPGALLYLRDLRLGAAVTVRAGGRDYRYAVQALRDYPKASLPAAAIFSQHAGPRLVIITCGGRFDPATHHYLDNVVAYAIPAG